MGHESEGERRRTDPGEVLAIAAVVAFAGLAVWGGAAVGATLDESNYDSDWDVVAFLYFGTPIALIGVTLFALAWVRFVQSSSFRTRQTLALGTGVALVLVLEVSTLLQAW